MFLNHNLSSCLEQLLIIITQFSYELILRTILRFILNLFFCTAERFLLQLLRSASKDASNVSFGAAPRECCENKKKRKCIEPERERMSDDLMLVTSRMETLWYKKSYFILKNLVQFGFLKDLQSEILCTGNWKAHCVSPVMELLLLSFFLFLTETFVLNLYNFNIAENVDIVGTAF